MEDRLKTKARLRTELRDLRAKVRDLEALNGQGHPAPHAGHSRESESRYRRLFEESPVSLWDQDFSDILAYAESIKDRHLPDNRAYLEAHPDELRAFASNLRILDVNKATLALFEAGTKDELLSSLEDIFTQKVLETFKELLILLLEGGTRFATETTIRTLKGAKRRVALSFSLVNEFNGSSRQARALIAMSDVTDRGQAEGELRKSESRYRSVVENIPVCIHEIDLEGRFLSMNDKGLEMLGLEHEAEIIGTPMLDMVSPGDREKVRAIWESARDGKGSDFEFATAETLHARVFASSFIPVTRDDGSVSKVLGVTEDITERNRSVSALQESETRLRTLIDTLPDLVWLKDPHGAYLACNRRYEDFIGNAEQALIGHTDKDFEDDANARTFQEQDRETIESGGKVVNEVEVTFADDGRRVLLETIKVPMHEPDGRLIGVLGIARDITERKRHEEFSRIQASRAEALLDLPRLAEQLSETEFLQRGLELAEDLTGSRISFLYSIGADEETLESLTVSRRTIDSHGKAARGPSDKVGDHAIWTEALHQRQPLVINKISEGDEEYGLAAGITGLKNLVTLPVIENGRVTMIIIVANKDTDYTDLEVETLQLVANEIWRIVQWRRAERQAARFSRVLESTLHEIYIFDSDTLRFVDVNEGARENLGYSRQELLGMTPLDLKPEFTETLFSELIEHLRSGASQVVEFSTVHRRKDGTMYPVEVNLQLLADEPSVFVALVRDTGERVQMEHELRKLALAVEQSPVSILITNAQGEVEFVNQAFEQTTGFSREDMVGLKPGRGERAGSSVIDESLQEALRYGRSWAAEINSKRKDGTSLVEFERITPIRQPNGAVTNFLVTREDITERKQLILELEDHRLHLEELVEERTRQLQQARKRTEEAHDGLRQQTALLEQAARISKLGHARWDEVKNEYTSVSEEYASIFGYTPEEFLALFRTEEGDLGLVHPDDRAKIEAFNTILSAHEESVEYRVLHRDGSTRHVREIEQDEFDDEGNLVASVVSIQDITELKKAQSALVENERQFREAARVAHLGHWRSSVEGNELIVISEEFAEIYGYTVDEFMQHFSRFENEIRLIHPDDRERVREIYDRKAEAEIEYRIMHREGGIRHVREHCKSTFDASGNILERYGTLQDITDAKRIEMDLRAARDAAEAAGRAKSEFLANMSHEIRTPMNAIVVLTQLLLQSKLTPEQMKRLTQIEASTQHLLSVINDVLDLSKIEAGRLSLEQRDFHLDALFDYVRSILNEQASVKGLEFEVDRGGVPQWLRGDLTRLRQVLLNYTHNAVKFSEQSTIHLRAELCEERDGLLLVRFEVQDHGIGIDEDQLPHIFESFSQADASTTRKYGGTGLGLTINHHLARMLGGEVGADSRPGEGSTFWFTARLSRGKDVRDPEKIDAGELLRSRHKGARILVVEDNSINREVVTELLHSVCLEVDAVEGARKALARTQQSSYDLVLMDIQMPEMDGMEATRRIRAQAGKDNLPILALTANIFEEHRKAYKKAGMDGFVAKPIDSHRLFSAIAECLQERPGDSGAHDAKGPSGSSPRTVDHVEAADSAAVDPAALIGLLGEDAAKRREILQKFIMQGEGILAEICMAFESRDEEIISFQSHKLKSSAGTVGARDLAAICAALESAGRNSDWPEIDRLHAHLEPNFDRVRAYVEEY